MSSPSFTSFAATAALRSRHGVRSNAHGRIAQHHVVLRVVAFQPIGDEIAVVEMHEARRARRGGARQRRRQRGETRAELPAHRVPDGLAFQDVSEAVSERVDLRVRGLGRLNRKAPGAIDVADDGERAAVGMRTRPAR